MSEPYAKPQAPAKELDVDELTQEIDAPFADSFVRNEEPTLTRLDFEEIELALDL